MQPGQHLNLDRLIMQIVLDQPGSSSHDWFSLNDTVFIKGYAFSYNQYVDEKIMSSWFENCKDFGAFCSINKKINGVYSVVCRSSSKVFVYSDLTRFHPLFYSVRHGILSDNPYLISDQEEVDEDALADYRGGGFVLGNKTLHKDVFQVQASEAITFDQGQLIRNKVLFHYRKQERHSASSSLYDVLNATKDKLCSALVGRTPVIPLSGGYDSRLLATLVKECGYHNAICFCYGRNDSLEKDISKRVADKLGFDWYFIESSRENIDAYFCVDELKRYVTYASRLSALPHLHEYLSLKYLMAQGIIPDNALFIPGHSGDFLGGSQYVKIYTPFMSKKMVLHTIMYNKFSRCQINRKEHQIIKSHLIKQWEQSSCEEIHDCMEDWFMKELLPKVIFNSSHIYTFFGYRVIFPFWDQELIAYFQSLPWRKKLFSRHYHHEIIHRYFKPNSIHYKSELSPRIFSLVRQFIKHTLLFLKVFPLHKKKNVTMEDTLEYKFSKKTIGDVQKSLSVDGYTIQYVEKSLYEK